MSNVIKSNRYVPIEQIRTVEAYSYRPPESRVMEEEAESGPEGSAAEEESAAELAAGQLLEDAQLAAEEQLRMAEEEIKRKKDEATSQIEKWWEERRLEDLRIVEESRASGFDTGYQDGVQRSETEMREKYERLIQEAAELVKEAHRIKEAIISESEPFLVELATQIARKIVVEHMAVEPEWTVQHVKRTLERRRGKGPITLCVAPSQFARFQDARAELTLSVDSQAELQIVPDLTVDEGGCVVRSDFGSIDARIDTQLAELKAVLMDVASRDEGAASS